MKTLLALLLTCAAAFGQALPAHRAIATPTPASGTSETLIVNETFEGTGYSDGSWTEAGGTTPNEDYTGANIIDGSQSLECNTSSASSSTYRAYTLAQADQYFFFKVRYISGSGDFLIATLMDSSGNSLAVIRKKNADAYSVQATGGTEVSTVNTYTDGAVLYMWVHFTQGSGANATARIWCSASGTKPADASNDTATSSNGTTTAQGGRFRFGYTTANTCAFYFDTFKIDNVALGNQ